MDVSWDEAKGDNIDGYRVDVGTPSNPRQFTQRFPRGTTRASFPGLDPDTDYQVNIVSTAGVEESEPLTKAARTSECKFYWHACFLYLLDWKTAPEAV